jgi:hypothetical protein
MSQWSPGKRYEEASDPTGIKALDRGDKRDQLDFTNKLATDKAQLDKETLADAQLKNKIAMLKFLGKGPRGDLISDILNQDLAGGGMFNVDKNNPQAMQAMVTALQGLDPNDNGTVNPAALQSIVQMGLGPDVADDPSIGNEGSASESRFDAGGSAGGTGAPASDVSGKFKIHQLGTPSTTPPPGGTPWKQGGLWNIGANNLTNTAEEIAEQERRWGLAEKVRKAHGIPDFTNPAVRSGVEDQVGLAESMHTIADLWDDSYAGIGAGKGKQLEAFFKDINNELGSYVPFGATEEEKRAHAMERRNRVMAKLASKNSETPQVRNAQGELVDLAQQDLIKFRRWQNAVQNMVMLAVTKRGGKALTATEIALISSSYGEGLGAEYMKTALVTWHAFNNRQLMANYEGARTIERLSGFRQNILRLYTDNSLRSVEEYAAKFGMTPAQVNAAQYGITTPDVDGTPSGTPSGAPAGPARTRKKTKIATQELEDSMTEAERAVYDSLSPEEQGWALDDKWAQGK